MNHEEHIEPDLKSALKALAEADRELGAPLEVEARVKAAFRAKHKRPSRMPVWIAISAAAGILLGVGMNAIRHPQPKAGQIAKAPVIVQGRVRDSAPAPRIASANPDRQTTPVQRVVHAKPQQAPQEIVTDFFPLAGYAPADDVDGSELLRVTLPAVAMREVGLPVREERLSDRVQADVLVSHGVARAVRFVTSE